MPVLDIIEEASAHLPVNESTTCEWVIVPTLLELGYKRWEIVSRVADSNGQFPDYTILPDTDSTWYLEAKAWNVALQDSHVNQSINYANQNAKRWVVLTNGQTWRLYDNDIKQATPSGKLVASAGKDDTVALETLLNSLSRDSVSNGGLERYADNSRLASELSSQLRDENSEVVRAIWNVLQKRTGLGNISLRSIAEHFGASAKPVVTVPTKSTRIQPPVPSPQPRQEQSFEDRYSLAHLAENSSNLLFQGDRVAGERRQSANPREISFPDGTTTPVRTWAAVAEGTVTWLMRNGHAIPVPFQPGNRGDNYFVNSTSNHNLKPMKSWRKLEDNASTVFLDTNRSAGNFLLSLVALCQTIGVDPATITITLA